MGQISRFTGMSKTTVSRAVRGLDGLLFEGKDKEHTVLYEPETAGYSGMDDGTVW